MSFSEASGIITQTGTDTNLSGLNGVTGVTVVDNGSHKTYHLDDKKLRINGTLTIDPQVECLLFERQNLDIYGTLNFGVTSSIGGATRYSRSIGLISHDDGYERFLVQSGGTLNWNGGAMKLRGGCNFMAGSTVNITNGIIIATHSTTGQRLRMNTADCSVDGLSIDGNLRFDVFKTFVSFNRYNSSFTATGAIQKIGSGGNHGGTDDPFVLTDFDAQGLRSSNGDFIGSSYAATKIEFVNMGFTGDFIIAHDSTGGTKAVTTLYKDVELKIVDTNMSIIEGAKYWATDKNNDHRFVGTAEWRGNMNADETFSSDRVYTGSTNSSGEATTRLLTRTCYGGKSTGSIYNGETTVDYRGETTDNTDVFNFYIASYEHTLNNVSPSCIGTGVLEQQVVLFADVFLTESDKTIVDAYAEIDTPEKFYNRAKAYLVDNYAGETSTIVSRDGNTIDAGTYDVVVDAGAGSAFAISDNTLTIKATTFVGNIITSGSTTLSNNAVVIGTFGATTVLPWEVKNVEATTRLQLYNLSDNTLIITQKLTGTAGAYVDATGTYTQTQIAEGDVVRLRCTCAVGATAMLPTEITGVATSTGITFSVDQQADEVYNANGIDGSSVSTLIADYDSPMGVDVSDADGTASVKEIYAFFVYSTTTVDGVDKWFGGMRAIDNANYEVVTDNADIKIQNIGTNAVIVSDGRLYRDDQASVLYADSDDKPITMDSGALVTSIQPQVESALNSNSKIGKIYTNSNLIPGLL
jgi:hypothetical protein